MSNSAKITFYQDPNGEHRWQVQAGNNQVIGASTEGYSRKEHAINNLKSLTVYATTANLRVAHEGVDHRPENAVMPVEFYRDQNNDWRWRITARNGNRIHASSESFVSLSNAKENLELLRDAVQTWDLDT